MVQVFTVVLQVVQPDGQFEASETTQKPPWHRRPPVQSVSVLHENSSVGRDTVHATIARTQTMARARALIGTGCTA